MGRYIRETSLTDAEKTKLAKRIYQRRVELRVSQATVGTQMNRRPNLVSYAEHGKLKTRKAYEAILNALSQIENQKLTGGYRAKSA